MKSRQNIVLLGIGGVYNYGCEAIVRGTYEIVRSVLPDSHIIYPSLRFAEDRKTLADIDIEVVNACPKGMRARVIRKVHRCLQWVGVVPRTDPWFAPLLPHADCMLSIGGDIYTIDANAEEKGYSHPLVEFGNWYLSRGGTYVLWGCSVGPFERSPEIRRYFTEHLRRCDYLVAREKITSEYLIALGCEHVATVADAAFLMKADNATHVDLPRAGVLIGVNLSEFSIQQRFPMVEWESRRNAVLAEIRGLLDIENAAIVLIPHVQPGNGSADDDVVFLKWIEDQLNTERVRLLPEKLGASVTKGVVARCDLLIAARMHCAIAGVSSGVPTLFLSYSEKARGMARYVYGNECCCIDLADFGNGELLSRARNILARRLEIGDVLRQSLPTWQRDARHAGMILQGLVGKSTELIVGRDRRALD